MVAADGFGLDSATGNLYVTDIFGNGIWRIGSDGSAHLWTSGATNPLLVLPDGVKVFDNAVYVSLEAGKILRIPINADGSAGTATVWAHIDEPGVFFDDMTLDDRTGDVFVARIDTSELLQITPNGTITPVATHADGLLGAANMVARRPAARAWRSSRSPSRARCTRDYSSSPGAARVGRPRASRRRLSSMTTARPATPIATTMTPVTIDEPGSEATKTRQATAPTTFSARGQRRCSRSCVNAAAFATA
jgi:hypothetical protein